MKKAIALSLVLVLLLGMAAVGASASASEGKTKIKVLRPGDAEKVEALMVPMVEKFMAANPDIEVEIMYEGWGGWIQTFPTYFESDTQPDVIWWWDNKQNDASAKPHLVNLKKYIDQSVFDSVPASVLAMTNVSGNPDEVYYIPGTVDNFALQYNADVFTAAGLDPDNPPKTWDELLAACEAIKTKVGIQPIGVPGKAGMETLQEFVAHFVCQSIDNDMVDANNQPTFNTPEGLAAFEFLQKLWAYVPESATEATRGDLRTSLMNGDVAMIWELANSLPTYRGAYEGGFGPIRFAEPPLPPSGKKIVWTGTNGWVATRESTAEASCKLISYLMQPEQEAFHHTTYGLAPLLPAELEVEPSFANPEYKSYLDMAANYTMYGMIGKFHPTPSAFYTELEQVWQKFMVGQLDPQGTIDEAVAAINAINERQGI